MYPLPPKSSTPALPLRSVLFFNKQKGNSKVAKIRQRTQTQDLQQKQQPECFPPLPRHKRCDERRCYTPTTPYSSVTQGFRPHYYCSAYCSSSLSSSSATATAAMATGATRTALKKTSSPAAVSVDIWAEEDGDDEAAASECLEISQAELASQARTTVYW